MSPFQIEKFADGYTSCASNPVRLHEGKPLPLGPSHVVFFSGAVVVEGNFNRTRAKQDTFLPILTLRSKQHSIPQSEHMVSVLRSCSRPDPGVIRLKKNENRSSLIDVELRLVKGLKPPRMIFFEGISLIVESRHSSSPIIRSLETISIARKFLIDVPVHLSRIGNLVCVSACFACNFDAPYKEFVSLIPPDLRPETEIEFSVPHGLSLATFKVYADGRMVVESSAKNALGSVSISVKYLIHAARGGKNHHDQLQLSLSETAQFVAGQELNFHKVVNAENSFYMLQGKLMLNTTTTTQNDISGEMVPVAKLPEGFAPSSRMCFFVRNTLKVADVVAMIEIDQNGVISVSPVSETSSYLRIVSFSGISWTRVSPKICGDHSYSTSVFSNRLTEEDWFTIMDFIGEGMWDAALRRGMSEKFDWEKLRDSVLQKRIRSLIQDFCCDQSVWAKKLLHRLDRGNVGMESVAMGVAEGLIKRLGLANITEKLKKILTPPIVAIQVGPKLNVRRHVSVNAFDVFRFSSRKSSHQVRIAKRADRSELEKLAEIIAWWNQWNTSEKFITHSSLMGNHDIFTDTGKWSIPDDPAIQAELFGYMAWIYKRGYDTFISEIQTNLYPLIEDLDMESTLPMKDTSQMDEMFLDESLAFIKERARALKVIYPEKSEFVCHVFSSSGFNISKGRWKSSFHLVWPDLIVNGELAPIIRQTTVEYFIYKSQTSAYFKHMQTRLVNHYDANIWENVFDQTTSNANNGLRMPFCNKATWNKTNYGTKFPSVENRRCYPKGSIKICFEDLSASKSPLERLEAKQRALRLILEAESREASNMHAMTDQNRLVGDRTQYKQSDKNSIHRTSAFIAGMKSIGGDLREFLAVTAKWTERVDNIDSLTESEIATWIQRGSCRRQPGSVPLSEYNKDFVQCYLEADLVWFQGLTIDSLRESDKYKKLTPAGQQGLKIRFKKYLQSQAGGGIMTARTGESDLERLHLLAQKVREARSLTAHSTKNSIGYNLDPETDDDEAKDEEHQEEEEEIDMFDLWGASLDNLFSFHESLASWEAKLSEAVAAIGFPNGYWVHSPFALTWISPRSSNIASQGGWGCFNSKNSCPNEQTTVSLYYHCGKVVASGNKDSIEYKRIRNAITLIAKPDDRLYHKLPISNDVDSFPLLDASGARAQREEFQRRWSVMEETSVGSEADEI